MRSLLRASLCASVLFAVLSLSTNLPEFIAHEFFATCYGNDPKDQQQIKAGFQFYENHCGG